MFKALLPLLVLILMVPLARADEKAPYRDFEQTCLSIFAKHATQGGPSGVDENNAAGKRICSCTSKESKHQGVTVPELKSETAKIKKDPKYQIENPKLLASFQYCVILAMDQRSHDLDSNDSNSK